MPPQTQLQKCSFHCLVLNLFCTLNISRAETSSEQVVFEEARNCTTEQTHFGGCWAPLYPCVWGGRARCVGNVCQCKEGYCASNGRCEWKARCHGSAELVSTNQSAFRNVSVELVTTTTTTTLCPKHTSGGCGLLKDCGWRGRAHCVNETCTCNRNFCTSDGEFCEFAPQGLTVQTAETTTTTSQTPSWRVTTSGGCGAVQTCQWRGRASCTNGTCTCHEGYFSVGAYCERLQIDCLLSSVELPAITSLTSWRYWSGWALVALSAPLVAWVRRSSHNPSDATIGLLSSA